MLNRIFPKASSLSPFRFPFCKVSLLKLEEVQIAKDENDKDSPLVFLTKRYGALKRIFSCDHSNLEKIDKTYFLDNKCSVNFLFKALKEDKKGLLIFEPENSNNLNILRIFSGVKKKLLNQYFGDKRTKKNAFRNCKNPKEIYHLHRRIQMEYKSELARVHVIANYNGEIRTKDISSTSSNDSSHIAKILPPFYTPKEGLKHDFLLSVGDWQGLYRAGKSKLDGVEVKALGNERVYPFYGVWPPTQQDLYIMLRSYLEEEKRNFKNCSKCLDIGVGTGVLSLIMATVPGIEKFYAIDVSETAVDCANSNWALQHPGKNLEAKKMDLVNLSEEEIANFWEEKRFPTEIEVMIANPPWINAAPMREDRGLEKGNYDLDFQFLKRLFFLANKYLSKSSIKGRLLLLHSDISVNLGLCEPDFIESLLTEFNLKSSILKTHQFLSEREMKSSQPDPLFNAKKNSKLLLLEITRV